ncbi:hypothetical protein ABZP36_011320 [Zizania latifolia]
MEGVIYSLTEGAVKSLLCKLGCLLSQESWLVQGVHGEIQYIKDELECMNAFLRNLTISEIHDDQVRIWMKQVREIAYDSEDCIDEFIHHLGESSEMGLLRWLISMPGNLVCRHHIAIQLQELKARARDVGERRSRYGVVLAKATCQEACTRLTKLTSHHLDPQLRALFMVETQLVGIDEPRDELVSWLMEEDPRLRVLAIVGFGGLGKTTLARMVCESPVVKSADFQCYPLFFVSQAFNIRTLFQHMVRELIQEPHKAMAMAGCKNALITEDYLEGMERWEVAVLTENLRQYFQDKRKTNACKLPRLLGNLKHLETLDIRATLVKKLPASAENWKAFLESLGKLSGSLRSLSIHILEEKEHSSSLDNLAFVEPPPLSLTSFSLTGKLECLPPWISSLRNLCRLTLRSTGLYTEAIGVLGDLPNLLCLKLYHKSYADDCIVFPHGKFTKVNLLIIDNLESIEKVHFEEGSVPGLERLTLSFLQEPKDGISGLENLMKLKEIEFFGDIILSVVTEVASCVKAHPNHPRVIGDRWNIVTEYT